MIGTYRSWRTDAGIHTGTTLRKQETVPVMAANSIDRRRSAIAQTEPEDAHLTGMTRSLDRRLLALNLKPATAAVHTAPVAVLKVA